MVLGRLDSPSTLGPTVVPTRADLDGRVRARHPKAQTYGNNYIYSPPHIRRVKMALARLGFKERKKNGS